MNTAYDEIAAIYDADMGASMHLPDVDYYTRLALAASGPVLELGCGTGRVLAALLSADVEAVGIDLSQDMLEIARERLGQRAKLVRMDMRALALNAQFGLVLLPYSLVTYLLSEQEWKKLASGLRTAVRANAYVCLDAFVPSPSVPIGSWIPDYARLTDGQWLVRHKRITCAAGNCNRIERRYRFAGHWGGRTLVTTELLHPYDPDKLLSLARRHLGEIERIDYDYGTRDTAQGAQFVSALVRLEH